MMDIFLFLFLHLYFYEEFRNSIDYDKYKL